MKEEEGKEVEGEGEEVKEEEGEEVEGEGGGGEEVEEEGERMKPDWATGTK